MAASDMLKFYGGSIVAFGRWDKLLYGIGRGECILFLGPDLPLARPGGEQRLPVHALAERLSAQLDDKDPDLDRDDLARVAQRFLAQEDEMSLEMEVTRWHQELAGERSALHDDLAALPFRLIVTSGHDPLMETALRQAGKAPAVERYHYRGTNQELLPEPSIEAPVLFHLHGHAAEPPSVVLTETQLLDFLAALISRNPPLPNDLNAALTGGRLFLFLGFGLDRWHLRILLHVLKVLRRGSRAFAIETSQQDAGAPEVGAVLFFRENFKVEVHRQDVPDFVRELRRRHVPPAGASGPAGAALAAPARPTRLPAAAGPRVFLCHASENKDRAREIHDALKRAGLDPWLDQEALRGGDRWDALIESTIKEVDYFVVLNSRALAAKSRQASYVNKEINEALEARKWRLVKHFIIPVTIDDAPLLAALADCHAVDLGAPDGLRDLVRAIKRQAAA